MKATLGRRWLALLLTLALCLTLAPAVFADDPDNPDTPPTLTGISVTLDKNSLSLIEGKETGTLTATVTETPTGADTTGLTYTWDSSNKDAATVSGSGNTATVTPVGPGTTNITVAVQCGTVTSNTATCTVTVEDRMESVTLSPNDSITLEPGGQSDQITANTTPPGQAVTWNSSNPEVATVSRGIVYAIKPGEAEIKATIGSGDNTATSRPITVTVNGIKLEYTSLTLQENESRELPIVSRYGAASNGKVTWQPLNPDVAEVLNGRIVGRGSGRATFIVSVGGGVYTAQVNVTVTSDPATTIEISRPLGINDTLSFDSVADQIDRQAENDLSHITGVSVPTNQGTLYYRYYSEAEPGQGVAQSGSYYLNPGSGQRGLRDITFVPKPDFAGGRVTITYTAVSNTYQNYPGRILLEVKGQSGSQGEAKSVNLTTPYNTPVKLSGAEFNRVCEELNGVSLSSVTFTQPSPRQGGLYSNYISAGNYGSLISSGRSYSRRELDDITFVPAPGYEGTVTIAYTGRTTSYSGNVYSGQISITVGKAGSSITVGGPSYTTAPGGTITFDDSDFEDYREDVLSNGRTLSHVRFDSLPAADQGTLYYDYRSSTSTGSQVSTGTSYYYGTRTPRLDRITFAAASGYTGTLRIPFTAWDQEGRQFSGHVELNVRGGSGSGDIRYTCTAGRTVNFDEDDFNDLSREITGYSLNYIVLRGLPSSADGYLQHNGSRINSTGTRYYYGSSSNRIDRLSFKADSRFSGSVDIPFEGYARSGGGSFTGVITIDSRGGYDLENIRYTTDWDTAAKFQRSDFDDLSQWETDRNVSSVRFSVPASSQGSLYRNYYSSSSMGTRISSSGTSVSGSELNRVAFVPAKNFVGTVSIDFTATAQSGGGTFTGTVEITVERPSADVTVRYSTRTAPVHFLASDFARRNYTLSSIQFSSVPSTDVGYLYYRYTSPTRYERQASRGTTYRVSGSNLISDLTFVPRAGYTGTVSIPYTGTNSSGSTFTGEVLITVSPTYGSSYFRDLGGYSGEQQAAVDFLRENGIASGMSPTEYGPENSIRRGDFCLMVYTAFDFTPSSTPGTFRDVPSGAYYAQAVNALASRGIVNGVGGSYFDPEGTLTRQDAMCIIQRSLRAIGWSASDGAVGYLDGYSDGSSVDSYAQGAVALAVQRGYLPIRGGRLEPRQPLSRIDMAQVIHRVLTY